MQTPSYFLVGTRPVKVVTDPTDADALLALAFDAHSGEFVPAPEALAAIESGDAKAAESMAERVFEMYVTVLRKKRTDSPTEKGL